MAVRRLRAGDLPAGSTRTLARGDGDGGTVRRTVLPGGLRVVTETVPGVRSATYGVWVGVGSRDEAPSLAGASHFLEHLLFKGTRRRTGQEINAALDAVGGEANAFTGKESTCFYARVLDADLPLAIDVVSDLVTSSRVTAADVDSERGVVLEEIAMHDDDPGDVVHDDAARLVLGDGPLGRPVLGTVESIEGMTRAGVAGHYRRRYRPERTVVAVAGNVAHDDVVGQVAAAFDAAGYLDGDAEPEPPRTAPTRLPRRSGGTTVDQRPGEQANLVLAVPGLSRTDERRFALGVLDSALGGGMSSRLFQRVREERGLAYSVYSYTAQYAGAGLVGVYAGCQPSKVEEVLRICRDTLAEVAAEGITEEELRRGQGSMRGGLVLGLEDTGSRMTRLGKSELSHPEFLPVEEIIARIGAVTLDDVRALAAELLGQRPSLAVVGPVDDDRVARALG